MLGLRVLAIEAKPDHSIPHKAGLADIIAGRAGMAECVVHGTHGAVDRLYGGAAFQDQDLLPADPVIEAIRACEAGKKMRNSGAFGPPKEAIDSLAAV